MCTQLSTGLVAFKADGRPFGANLQNRKKAIPLHAVRVLRPLSYYSRFSQVTLMTNLTSLHLYLFSLARFKVSVRFGKLSKCPILKQKYVCNIIGKNWRITSGKSKFQWRLATFTDKIAKWQAKQTICKQMHRNTNIKGRFDIPQ